VLLLLFSVSKDALMPPFPMLRFAAIMRSLVIKPATFPNFHFTGNQNCPQIVV
jgi:hypothetical protein